MSKSIFNHQRTSRSLTVRILQHGCLMIPSPVFCVISWYCFNVGPTNLLGGLSGTTSYIQHVEFLFQRNQSWCFRLSDKYIQPPIPQLALTSSSIQGCLTSKHTKIPNRHRTKILVVHMNTKFIAGEAEVFLHPCSSPIVSTSVF